METILSVAYKVQLDDYIITDGLNQEMLDTMTDYLMIFCFSIAKTLRGVVLSRSLKLTLWRGREGESILTILRQGI